MPIFSNNSEQRTEFYKELQRREQQWWQARQRLVMLRERRMFWFGDNSLIMWLLWQLVSYVVVATVLMLLGKLLQMSLPLWGYIVLFGIQTLIFVIMFTLRGRLVNHLQNRINTADLVRETALNEMVILASDSIFPDIHAHAPISLQRIHERYEAQLRLGSLQCLLQRD